MDKSIPNPGSDKAIKKGCICPILDNSHGKGAFDFGDDCFWIAEGCPLHDLEAKKEVKDDKDNIR